MLPSKCPFPPGSIRALVWLLGDDWWQDMPPKRAARFFLDTRADEHATHYCAWAWRTKDRAEAIGRSAAIKLDPPDMDEIQRHVFLLQGSKTWT